MRIQTLLAALSFAGSLAAQVPYGYLVVAQTNTAPDGFRIVNPTTGDATDISEPNGNWLGGASCIAINQATSNAIIASAGGSFGGAPVWNIPLTDNFYYYGQLAGAALPMFGTLERMYATPNEILFTLSSVSDGLYTMPSIPGTPTQLSTLTDATDIAVINGTAYINSYSPGQPSAIVAVDLTTNAATTLGTGYATIRSLGTLAGTTLLAGRQDGDIDIIDTTTGAASTFATTGLGEILAIVDDGNANTYIATTAGSVYRSNNFTTPIYVSPHQLTDLDVGRVDQATQLVYGSGCGASGAAPQVATTPGPALGSTYSMQMTGAQPSTLGGIVLGYDRDDVDLSGIGLPGCALLAQFILIDAVLVDASGNGTTNLPIPSTPALIGTNLNSQFFVLETAGGIALSPGIEGHMR